MLRHRCKAMGRWILEFLDPGRSSASMALEMWCV